MVSFLKPTVLARTRHACCAEHTVLQRPSFPLAPRRPDRKRPARSWISKLLHVFRLFLYCSMLITCTPRADKHLRRLGCVVLGLISPSTVKKVVVLALKDCLPERRSQTNKVQYRVPIRPFESFTSKTSIPNEILNPQDLGRVDFAARAFCL